MRKQLISILILLFFSITVKSQSLIKIIDKVRELRAINPDSSVLLAQQAWKLLQKKPDSFQSARLFNALGTAYWVLGMPEEADSVYLIGLEFAKKSKNDTLQIFIYNNKGLVAQDYVSLEEALKSYRIALAIATRKNIHREIADTYNNIATSLMYYNYFDSAVYFYEKGIEAYKKETDKISFAETGIADIKTNIAAIHYKQGRYTLALCNYFESIKIFDHYKQWNKSATVSNNICDVYIDKNDYVHAEKYCRDALQYHQKYPVKVILAHSYFNLAKIFQANKIPDSSIKYYQLATGIYDELDLTYQLTNIYNSTGTFYNEIKNKNEALNYFNKALSINLSFEDTSGICVNYFNIAYTYWINNEILPAKNYNDKARLLLKPGMFYSLYYDIYAQSADIYSELGDFKNAYYFLQERNLYRDSLISEKNSQQQQELETVYQTEKKDQQLKHEKIVNEKQKLELDHAEKEKQVQQYRIQLMMLGGFVLLICIFIVIRSNVIRKKNNRILEVKNELISKQKSEVELKNLIIEEKQKEITDSINYAKRIQFSLLAQEEALKNNLNDYFVLFKPKDIVSGDFYWSHKNDNGDFFIAACDCTGHGVPGAFMSLLNISFLNESVTDKKLNTTGEILDFVRSKLIKNMEGGKDGMDAILLAFSNRKMLYSSAHNRPVVIRTNNLIELETDKMPVGRGENMKPFRTNEFLVEKNDIIYLTTDGYADQFGGPKGKKLKSSNLNKMFVEISSKPMLEQKEILNREFESWKGDLEQIDDVCIIGIRI